MNLCCHLIDHLMPLRLRFDGHEHVVRLRFLLLKDIKQSASYKTQAYETPNTKDDDENYNDETKMIHFF